MLESNDDNTRDLQKLFDTNEKIRRSQEYLIEKLERSDKMLLKINNEILKLNDIESSININKIQLDNFFKDYQDFEYTTNKKFSETESNILALVGKVKEINQNKKINTDNTQINTNAYTSNLNINSKTDEAITNNTQNIQKLNKEIDGMKKVSREFMEKIEKITNGNIKNEKLLADNSTKIIDLDILIKETILNLDIKFESIEKLNQKKIEEENDSKKIKSDQQIEILFDNIEKIRESIKSNIQITNSKVTRDDFDKISRIFNSEVEKLSTKFIEGNKNYDIKINKIIEKFNELNTQVIKITENSSSSNEILGGNLNILKFNENISDFFNEYFNKTLKYKIMGLFGIKNIENYSGENSPSDSCTENVTNIGFADFEIPAIKENSRKIDEIKIEINSIKDNIIILNSKKEKDGEVSKIETKLNIFVRRLNELDDLFIKNNKNNEERFKNIEGDFNFMDDISFQNEIIPNMNVFNVIKYNCINSIKDTKRIDRMNINIENMNNDLLSKLKKDLLNESTKILGDFKIDLKNSIGKIEDQLREKVDLFSLDEFGRKVDFKLNNEINKKLDRQDLKKNNNLINKKIDCLENKISKTLVDTLIDLQMDDTPLLLKNSMTGNGNKKCASCNQYLNNERNGNGNNNMNINMNCMDDECRIGMTNNNGSSSIKYKFRSIQDNSNKFGTGSYSRHLANIDNEDLRGKYNINLPNIPEKNISGNLNIKKNLTGNNFYKAKINETIEKRFNSMIDVELEKSFVNPDNFIKTANKLYDNVEKRNLKDNK